MAWLLCLLATIGALCLSLVVKALYWRDPGADLGSVAGVLSFTALITGVLTLLLTFAANRVRKVAPPASATRIAFAVGLAPLVLALISLLVDK